MNTELILTGVIVLALVVVAGVLLYDRMAARKHAWRQGYIAGYWEAKEQLSACQPAGTTNIPISPQSVNRAHCARAAQQRRPVQVQVNPKKV
jgi:hypothetical protein